MIVILMRVIIMNFRKVFRFLDILLLVWVWWGEMLRLELKWEVEEFFNVGRGWLLVNLGGLMIFLVLLFRVLFFGDDEEGKEVELILLMVLVGRCEEDGEWEIEVKESFWILFLSFDEKVLRGLKDEESLIFLIISMGEIDFLINFLGEVWVSLWVFKGFVNGVL